MKKQKKKSPSGMTKRTKSLEAGPQKPPPDIGDVVWYPDRKEAWRTGRLVKVIDRGKDWGRCMVKDSVSGRMMKVLPEHVKAI